MNITRRGALGVVVGAATLPYAGINSASAQTTIRLTMASSHPTALAWVGPLQTVVQRSNEILEEQGSEYRIDWTEAYGGQLYGLTETMEALTQNIADGGWVGAMFEPSDQTLDNIPFATPFTTSTVGQAFQIMDNLNRNEQAMIDEWARQDLLYFGSCGSDGYSILSREPLDDIDDLRGKRVVGVPVLGPWIEPLGASLVASGLPEMYSQLQTGVGDAVLIVGTGALPLRLHEVAPHIVKVDTGPLTFGGFCMNKTVFEGLPEEVQTVLAGLGEVYTTENRERIEALQATVYDTMVSEGATLREMPREEKVRWVEAMPDLGLNWVEANESPTVPAREMLRRFMDEAVAVGAEPLRDWAANI